MTLTRSGFEVVDAGFGARIGQQREGLPFPKQPADATVRVGQIAEVAGLSGTGLHARRLKSLIDAIHAEITLDDGALGPAPVLYLLVKSQIAVKITLLQQPRFHVVAILVRARRRAASATDTDVAVDRDNPVGTLVARTRRTDLDARRLGTMIAEYG